MTSRLTLAAALFAICASTSLAFAATVVDQQRTQIQSMKTVQLERVVITGKRIAE